MARSPYTQLAPEGIFGAQITTYPTPMGLGDMLFHEAFDSNLPANEKWKYGDHHPNPVLFPNHRLVYVQPGRGQGEQVRWFAARRICEDEYNWEHSQADVAGTKFNTIVRTYIYPRVDFRPDVPAQGDLMPNVPLDLFPTLPITDPPTPPTNYGGGGEYILAGREQHSTGDERIDSLFILEKRTYIDRAPISASTFDEVLGIAVNETTYLFYRNEPGFTPGGGGLLAPGGPYTEFKQLSDNWWSNTTIASIAEALDLYMKRIPVRVDLGDLPRQLIAVNIVWNKSVSIGTQNFLFTDTSIQNSGSLGKDVSDKASSSASVTAEVQMKFRDIASQNLSGTKVVFFMKDPVTEEEVLARLGAKRWPVFKPESSTITVTGQSISVTASVAVGLGATWENDITVKTEWSKASSDEFQVNLSVNSVQVTPCIHGNVVFTNAAKRSYPVSATAFMNMTHSRVGSISSTLTKSGTAYGEVFPTSLPPTAGQNTIPTSGIYLYDCDIQDYKLGYSKVTAIIFNANQLA
jgi:hypothetical protein